MNVININKIGEKVEEKDVFEITMVDEKAIKLKIEYLVIL